MKKTLIIGIPEPCDEGWNNMEPTAKGRNCSRCERELTDFTAFSNQQLVDYFDSHTGKICGHFASHQLNKNLVPAAASYSGLSLPALALLAVTLTATPAHSQTSVPTPISVQKDSLNHLSTVEQPITGKVIDAETGEPVPFNDIILRYRGTSIQGVRTDIDGNFSLLPNANAQFDTLLVRNLASYEDVWIPLTAATTKTGMLITVHPLPQQLKEIVDGMAIVIIEKPVPKKKRKHSRRK